MMIYSSYRGVSYFFWECSDLPRQVRATTAKWAMDTYANANEYQ